jgi:hypothetical protein
MAPAGKIRTLHYAICRKCRRRRSSPQEVERLFFKTLAAVAKGN